MNEAANRPGRIDRRDEPAFSRRLRSHALALALLALFAFAAGAASAQAAIGGLAPAGGSPAATQSQASDGIAFTPMRWAGATWYGPGLYGNRTACGQVLRPGTVGVAHRNLPCGTTVKFAYRGHQLVTRVIDRGPFSAGYSWDLTNGAREALGFEGSGQVRYAVELRYARR
jgi:rare lipoprotein A (peptidoglycan hydrolase)